MRILILDNDTFGKLDVIAAFEHLGYEVDLFYHEDIRTLHSQALEQAFSLQTAGRNYVLAFSLNYYPELSKLCNKSGLPYFSYVYDSPLVSLYSYTVINPCNHIFLFDRTVYEELYNGGIRTVYYLPLAANANRLSAMHPSDQIRSILSSDVSFVGSMYNEDHKLFDSLTDLSPYTNGYLEAIMEAQLKISGYFFIEELLTSDILADLKKSRDYPPQPDGIESPAYVYANYFIARKLTEIERHSILDRISSVHQLKLYTHNPTPELPKVINCGSIDYYDVMPYVFKCSKINLNISLRSIKSGIPLRAFDIIGSGGFLLSNYQADFFDCFNPREDFDYYEDEDDLLNKIDYYLSHEKERCEIAENGLRKLANNYTYEDRIRQMLATL